MIDLNDYIRRDQATKIVRSVCLAVEESILNNMDNAVGSKDIEKMQELVKDLRVQKIIRDRIIQLILTTKVAE